MLSMLLLGLAALAQDQSPIITTTDPLQGPMPGENHPLSQWHPGVDDRMFPDLAVKDLRIDGETLYVLVANQGAVSAYGPIQVIARAGADGTKNNAATARIGELTAGESRWVPLAHFKVALADAAVVSAAVSPPPAIPAALDRSGQGCNRCVDFNEANNSLTEEGSAIVRGRPE